jgi:two-component system, sensor histidine kinase ChiS
MKRGFFLLALLLVSGYWIDLSIANNEEPELFYAWQGFGQNQTTTRIAVDPVYVWGAHSNSVIRWHKNDYTFQKFTFGNSVTALTVALNNHLWVGTEDGLYRYNGVSWTRYTSSGGLFVTSLSTGPQGQLLLGVIRNILVFDGTQWTTIPTLGSEIDPMGCFQLSYIVDIAVDSQSQVWVSLSDGTCYFNGEIWQPLFKNSAVVVSKDIEAHSNGDVWLAGVHDGVGNRSVARVTPDGTLIFYDESDGLPSSVFSSTALTIDHAGHVWVGFDGGIVSRFNGSSWLSYDSPRGHYGSSVLDIRADANGDIWTGGTQISRLTGNLWTSYLSGSPQAPSGDRNLRYVTPEGRLWLSIPMTGAVESDGRMWRQYPPGHGPAGNTVDAITIDHNGNIWLGSSDIIPGFFVIGKGLTQFDGSNWHTFTTADGLANNHIQAIAADANNDIWITHFDGGLTRKSGSNWTIYTTADGLLENTTDVIIVHDNAVWISYRTMNGIARFDGANWVNYTSDDGLEGIVRGLAVDRNNILWALTEVGLFQWDGAGWLDMGISGQWYKLAVDAANRIWLTGCCSAAWFDGSQLHPATLADTGGYYVSSQVIANKSGDVLWFVSDEGLVKLKIFEVNARIFLPTVMGR